MATSTILLSDDTVSYVIVSCAVCVGDSKWHSLITMLNVQRLLNKLKVCQEEKFPSLELRGRYKIHSSHFGEVTLIVLMVVIVKC